MTRSSAVLALLCAVLLRPSLACAQAPQVQVQLGPAVQARAGELGRDELEQQRHVLERDVAEALARTPEPPRLVVLAIEDIQPSRATSSQLGASVGLSPFTRGLGGAAVTGQVTGSGGATRPVRFRWFPPDFRDQTDLGVWGDADDGFERLAALIAAGHPPDDPHAWPPPHAARAPTGTRIPG